MSLFFVTTLNTKFSVERKDRTQPLEEVLSWQTTASYIAAYVNYQLYKQVVVAGDTEADAELLLPAVLCPFCGHKLC